MRRLIIASCISLSLSILALIQYPAQALKYSAGTYGTCSYSSCSITLSSSGAIALSVTPTNPGTTCSIQSDGVTATTESSTGYTITMTDNDTTNSLSSSSATIPAVAGSDSSPVPLSANTWGYRVDGIANFGSGPTTALTNGTTPSVTFAAPPLSTATPATIRYTTTADSSSVTTPVWYGMCASNTTKSDTYTDTMVYTAIVNS